MLFKDAQNKIHSGEIIDLWIKRLEAVDKICSTSKSGWALDYWHSVRLKLSRQLNLLYAQVQDR